jgi:hypothetical protein
MSQEPSIAIGGSRRLSPAGSALATSLAHLILGQGVHVVTGCATGADAAVIRSAVCLGLGRQLTVLSAFGPVAQALGRPTVLGSCASSALAEVLQARRAGALVKPWAGGRSEVPLNQRLAARTAAVAALASEGAFIVAESELGPGSQRLAQLVSARGLPVGILQPGRQASAPPLVLKTPGYWSPWQPNAQLLNANAWIWRPAVSFAASF